MRRWTICVTALIIAACSPSDQPAGAASWSGEPRPALWKLADADTTVFLFGTVHLLPPDMTWRTPALLAAEAEARAVYLEADTELPPARLAAIIRQTALLAPGQRLWDLLSPDQEAALREAAARLGLPAQLFDTMRPWYASVIVSDAAIRNTGMSLEAGVETQLRQEAQRRGADLRFLETVEDQLSGYTGLSDSIQIALLEATLRDLEDAGEALADLVKAWRQGDDERLTGLVIDEQLTQLPEVYQMVMVRRNAAWAPQIDALLREEAGTFLVAVGAGHLLGPDSVLRMLEGLGHRPERVP